MKVVLWMAALEFFRYFKNCCVLIYKNQLVGARERSHRLCENSSYAGDVLAHRYAHSACRFLTI